MRTALRVLVTLNSVLAVLYYLSFIVDPEDPTVGRTFAFGSLIAVCALGWFVWTRTAKSYRLGLVAAIVLGAIVIGGLSFSAGFFGPIILTPEANQGPMLGIFFTGPLGFLIGAVAGAIYWFVRRRQKASSPSTGAV